MRRLAISVPTALALLALGLGLSATASALPQIHLLEGESFPVAAEGGAEGVNIAHLSTALSAPITTSKVRFSFECKELGSLCPYTVAFSGAEIEGKHCQTKGDSEGTLLIAGNEAHLVWLALEPLALGVDFLVKKTTETCVKGAEELSLTFEGQMIAKLEGVTSGTDATSFTLNLKCTKPNNGKQEVKEYFNDEGKLVKGVLTVNLGLGQETACEEVRETFKILTNKMVSFLF
jgi:hypothetical protein